MILFKNRYTCFLRCGVRLQLGLKPWDAGITSKQLSRRLHSAWHNMFHTHSRSAGLFEFSFRIVLKKEVRWANLPVTCAFWKEQLNPCFTCELKHTVLCNVPLLTSPRAPMALPARSRCWSHCFRPLYKHTEGPSEQDLPGHQYLVPLQLIWQSFYGSILLQQFIGLGILI